MPWPYTYPLGLYNPALGWSRYRDANPVPTSPLADDYAPLKEAVLKAYQLTSDAYCQLFRTLKKPESEEYVEYVTKKQNSFDKWTRS